MPTPPAAPRRFRLPAPDEAQGWLKYVWLVWLPPVFAAPYASGSAWQWAATVAGTGAFLWSYFRGFRVSGGQVLPTIALHVGLAVAFAPWNDAAPTFLIYGASFAGRTGRRGDAVRAILAVMLVGALTAWAIHAPIYFWLCALVFTPLVGAVNLQAAESARANARLRLAQEEVEHLATVAERERIGRDLHDVLGHTLSLIVLKAELASKLAEIDPARAAREIRDVEQVSRKALAEVREAIRGYRGTLDDEIARARSLLRAAGIQGELAVQLPPMDRAREEALALALREAVTNTVRHSGATLCRVRVAAEGGACTLTVSDDGRGGIAAEGHGLRGMRERVEALGGSVEWSRGRGATLRVVVPAGDAAREPPPAAALAVAGRAE
ncbi:MAG TPA: sensor histidine kinase [Longimicrobium sp.]|nr:sensor histidine kinase [Longimicrobium sp.]